VNNLAACFLLRGRTEGAKRVIIALIFCEDSCPTRDEPEGRGL
jgi:hypothetical protein